MGLHTICSPPALCSLTLPSYETDPFATSRAHTLSANLTSSEGYIHSSSDTMIQEDAG